MIGDLIGLGALILSAFNTIAILDTRVGVARFIQKAGRR
ncbi:hypothetical protein C7458_102763 [Williamsia muralis]|nr:hypothetical protein C7458_102763 [Williamsia marianensis]